MSSMSSVREFVKEFLRKKRKLHVLVNCAGVMLNSKDLTRRTTPDGLEYTMATNYFGKYFKCKNIKWLHLYHGRIYESISQ